MNVDVYFKFFSPKYWSLVILSFNSIFISPQPILKKERPCRLPRPSKQKDVRTECCVCNTEGHNQNLVRWVPYSGI